MVHLLIEFDDSLLIDRTRGEVSARCDSESANLLSLNMVHEIIVGRRTVEQARHILEQNKIAYTLGRDAPYVERLLLDLPQGGTQDLDTSAISGAVGQQLVGKVKDSSAVSRKRPTGAYPK